MKFHKPEAAGASIPRLMYGLLAFFSTLAFVLEEGKLRVTLIKAVVKASQRARELLVTDKQS